MLRGVILGSYMPLDSPVHRLDPRTKLAISVLFTVCVFMVSDIEGYAILFAVLATGVGLSRVRPTVLLRAMRPLAWVIGISFLFNALMSEGTPLVTLGPLHVTEYGLRSGIEMLVRLVLLLGASSLLTLATSPIAITDGLELLLSPLRTVGVPAHELALMMSIALRFVPTLAEEAVKIAGAQMSRGADFAGGGIAKRSRSLVSLMVPLFVSSFRRADELAMAMEARLYRGGSGRSRLRQLRLKRADVLTMALAFPSILYGALWH